MNSSTKINRLGKLLSIANDVLGRFGLPPFFDPPLFHISVACLPLSETTSSNIDLLEEQCRKLIGSNNFIEIIFKDIHIKIGNKIHTLPLKRGE